jgi:PAS domain S-box-containing protein
MDTANSENNFLGQGQEEVLQSDNVNLFDSKTSEWYRTALQTSMEGFIVDDYNGRIIEVNDAYCKMSGYSREELLTMNVCDLGHEFISKYNTIQELNSKIIEENGMWCEFQNRRKDGTKFDVSMNVNYLGVGIGLFFCSLRDITEQKKTLKKLKESENRYRTLIELGGNIGEAVVMLQDTTAVEGLHIFVSDQWVRITGYTRSELLRMSLFDLFPPDQRNSLITIYRDSHSFRTSSSYTEISIINKSGRIVPLELTGAITRFQGNRVSVAYIRDITQKKIIEEELSQYRKHLEILIEERTKKLKKEIKSHKRTEKALKNSELRYRTLFENAPAAIWEIDLTKVKQYFTRPKIIKVGDIKVGDVANYFKQNNDALFHCFRLIRSIGFNQAVLDLYEIENKSDFIDVRQELLFKHEEHRLSFQTLVSNIAVGNTRFSYEEFVPTFKGNWRHNMVKLHVAPGHEECLSLAYVSIFDITEIKILEENLKKAYNDEMLLREKIDSLYNSERELRQELEHEINEKADFIRTLVHELKTPLTPILSTSDFLVANIEDEPWAKAANNIRRGALRLERRINELYDTARMEIDGIKLNLEPLDISAIVHEIISDVSFDVKKRNQRLLLDAADSSLSIIADKERIYQVIYNLIYNAIKFTPQGGEITLKIRKANGNIVIEVINQGKIIPFKDRDNLFKHYYRGSGASPPKGLGIGLTLCKLIVELHNGKIWVKSKRPNLNIFGFSIPLTLKKENYWDN